MINNYTNYRTVLFTITLYIFIAPSSVYAANEQIGSTVDSLGPPGSSASVVQDCTPQKNIFAASIILEKEIIECARRGLDGYLRLIKKGEEEKFGFNSRDEFEEATIGNKPYQIHIRCQSETYPTNTWRVPVFIKSQVRAFITVDRVEDDWQSVEFGAAKLARDVSTVNKKLMKKHSLQNNTNLHNIIVRDHQKRTDSLLIKNYPTGTTTKANIILAFPEIIQEQNEWCWTGVAAVIFDYFNKNVRQCKIAEYTRRVSTWHDFGTKNCCAGASSDCNFWNYNWGTPGSIEDILESMQNSISIQNYGVGRKLTISEVENDLSNHRPFVIRWGWDNGGGHFLVGYGIDGGYLYYMNPWYGEGNKIGTYNWVSDGGEHTWTHTNRISKVVKHGDSTIVPIFPLLL